MNNILRKGAVQQFMVFTLVTCTRYIPMSFLVHFINTSIIVDAASWKNTILCITSINLYPSLSSGSTVKRVGEWLASIVDKCNEKVGSPYRKCKKIFKKAEEKCKSALVFDFGLCNIPKWIGEVCHIVRGTDVERTCPRSVYACVEFILRVQVNDGASRMCFFKIIAWMTRYQ